MAVKGGIEQYGIGRKGSLYENVNDASNSSAEWFGLDDCIGRIVRVLISYYAMMLMYPISFFIFLARDNMLWEEGGGMGKWVGLLTVCFYPFYPIVALVVLIVKRTCFALGVLQSAQPTNGSVHDQPWRHNSHRSLLVR